MNARFLRRAVVEAEPVAPVQDAPLVVVERACCCPARSAVRIVMPPSPTRGHETELLLCGHHYRASAEALSAAGAAVYDLPR
jgi:hypothetical protein